MVATYSWVLHNESFWRWFVHVTISNVVNFVYATLILAPIWLWVRRQLDPASKGGVGDIPDEHGVPAHVRIAQAQRLRESSEQ